MLALLLESSPTIFLCIKASKNTGEDYLGYQRKRSYQKHIYENRDKHVLHGFAHMCIGMISVWKIILDSQIDRGQFAHLVIACNTIMCSCHTVKDV